MIRIAFLILTIMWQVSTFAQTGESKFKLLVNGKPLGEVESGLKHIDELRLVVITTGKEYKVISCQWIASLNGTIRKGIYGTTDGNDKLDKVLATPGEKVIFIEEFKCEGNVVMSSQFAIKTQ